MPSDYLLIFRLGFTNTDPNNYSDTETRCLAEVQWLRQFLPPLATGIHEFHRLISYNQLCKWSKIENEKGWEKGTSAGEKTEEDGESGTFQELNRCCWRQEEEGCHQNSGTGGARSLVQGVQGTGYRGCLRPIVTIPCLATITDPTSALLFLVGNTSVIQCTATARDWSSAAQITVL